MPLDDTCDCLPPKQLATVVGGLAGGGIWFLHVDSVSGAWVYGGVRRRVGGGVWFHCGNYMCGVCV